MTATALEESMIAPILGGESSSLDLGEERGVVIRQVSQWLDMAQFVGIPIELANKYTVSSLPDDVCVARSPIDPDRWQPKDEDLTQLSEEDPLMRLHEESSSWRRCILACCGGLNLRPLTLHATQNAQPSFTIEKPCRSVCTRHVPHSNSALHLSPIKQNKETNKRTKKQ